MNASRLPWFGLATVLVAGVLAAFLLTSGFTAVTSDQARRADLSRTANELPALPLVDSTGTLTDLRREVGAGRYTVVSLVYTQCTTMCLLSASSGVFLQSRIRRLGLTSHVRVLTLSFDPAHDTPDALADYARRMRADRTLWKVATVSDTSTLATLLHTFGVVVLPDGQGGYVHNGALYVVDPKGRLVGALDPDAPEGALAFVRERIRQ